MRKQGRNSRAEAQDALDAFREEKKNPAPVEPEPVVTFKQAVERYEQAKSRKKSIGHDRLYLRQLQTAFGADTPLTELTAARISEWQVRQLAATCSRTGRPYAPASVNRPLAALRTQLTLAHERWGWLPAVPRIELAKEPEGRVRYLEPDEKRRLLDAARHSRNSELVPALIVSMETGLRRGELLGLNWGDVDMTRGLIRLDGRRTKSGKRREVPMRQEGSLQALREVLGHADMKMTVRYAHLSPDHLRAEIEKTARAGHSRTAAEQAHAGGGPRRGCRGG